MILDDHAVVRSRRRSLSLHSHRRRVHALASLQTVKYISFFAIKAEHYKEIDRDRKSTIQTCNKNVND